MTILETQFVLQEVATERQAQNLKWGEQNHTNAHWLAILTEEIGEVAECVCKAEIPPVSAGRLSRLLEMRNELVQVAAVATAWIEAFDRGNP